MRLAKSTLCVSLLYWSITSCSHSPVVTNQKNINYCSVGEYQITKQHQPPVPPKYFLKPVGKKNEIAYVATFEKKDQNVLLNLDSGEYVQIPGSLDPIGLFGTDLVSIPLDDEKGGLEMTFYDLRELRTHGMNTLPLLPPDKSLTGRYQSIGVLKSDGTEVQFRIITDGHGGGEFRDYKINFSKQPATLSTLSEVKPLCRNLRKSSKDFLNLKLPMISKDANFYSAFDVKKQIMKVFKLDQNGNCAESSTPQLERGDVGKFDFSPDSHEVAFHYSDRSLETSPIQFGVPEQSWQLRSAIYNFKNQSYRILAFSGAGANTYYPAFMNNGDVLVLESIQDRFQFIKIDPKKIKEIPREKLEELSKLKSEDFQPFLEISSQWMQDCSSQPTSSLRHNRLLVVLSLSQPQCTELVKNHQSNDSALKQKMLNICNNL